MNTIPGISIAIATFNGERYLREQLDSILVQTIPFSEMVICDDCSTDGTWKILSEYAEKDARIKLYRNENNLGFLKNFERALTLCSGEYVALSDQDDIWLPEHLEVLLNGIGDKGLAIGDAEITDSAGNRTGLRLSYCENASHMPERDIDKAYTILYYRGCFQGASMLMRRGFLDRVLPIPDIKGLYHDVWFSFIACLLGEIQIMEPIITLYRRHDAAVSGRHNKKMRLRTVISHLLLKRASYRPELLSAVRETFSDSLTIEQKSFLDAADKYYERRKSMSGRIMNAFFELKHFKLIYGGK